MENQKIETGSGIWSVLQVGDGYTILDNNGQEAGRYSNSVTMALHLAFALAERRKLTEALDRIHAVVDRLTPKFQKIDISIKE